MRFFSKIVFICNCCFLLSVVMRYVELHQKNAGISGEALGYQPLTSTIVILGYAAVLLNAVFLLLGSYSYIFRKEFMVARWLLLFNLVLFVLQLIYFLY